MDTLNLVEAVRRLLNAVAEQGGDTRKQGPRSLVELIYECDAASTGIEAKNKRRKSRARTELHRRMK